MSDELVDQAERLVDQLRSLPLSRLERRSDSGGSLAQSAHALAQRLADLAADLEGRPRREIPELHPLASGDIVAVTVHDLVDAANGSRDSVSVDATTAVTGIEQPPSSVALHVATAAVRALRDEI